MARGKAEIHVSGLNEVFTGRVPDGHPLGITALFGEAVGLAAVEGREVVVHIPAAELADILGSIPASEVEDPDDFRHLARTMQLLRRDGKAVSAMARQNPA